MQETIWINACEASGDMHGAALMAELLEMRPGLSFEGVGGPAMAAAGQEQVYTMADLSLVGVTEVLASLPRILGMFRTIKQRLKERPPKALVLIDAPDFNFRLARMAHGLGIPVYYYISPQVWAWRSGRVKFLERYCRKVLCILPFEKDFYASRGVDVEYVGHPLLDLLPLGDAEADVAGHDPKRIGILPGSRRKEIARLLPRFASTAEILHQVRPDLRFSLVRAPGVTREKLAALWPSAVPVEYVAPEERYQAMGDCALILASSGTATLEAALLGTPCIVAYRMSFFTALLAWFFVHVSHISLPNLILNKRVFPELIQYKAHESRMLAWARRWLDEPDALAEVRSELVRLRRIMGGPGAARRAASLILDSL